MRAGEAEIHGDREKVGQKEVEKQMKLESGVLWKQRQVDIHMK